MMFSGNEIGPVVEAEFAASSVLLLAANLIKSSLFGEMAVLLVAISKRSQLFQNKIDTVNTAMKDGNIPQKIQEQVRDYFF